MSQAFIVLFLSWISYYLYIWCVLLPSPPFVHKALMVHRHTYIESTNSNNHSFLFFHAQDIVVFRYFMCDCLFLFLWVRECVYDWHNSDIKKILMFRITAIIIAAAAALFSNACQFSFLVLVYRTQQDKTLTIHVLFICFIFQCFFSIIFYPSVTTIVVATTPSLAFRVC